MHSGISWCMIMHTVIFTIKKTESGLVTCIVMAALHKQPKEIYSKVRFIYPDKNGIVYRYLTII